MLSQLSPVAFCVALYLVVPIGIAKLVLRASWKATALAYAIWTAILLLLGIAAGGTWGEKLGWPMIVGLFTTFIAIPIIVLVLKLFRVR